MMAQLVLIKVFFHHNLDIAYIHQHTAFQCFLVQTVTQFRKTDLLLCDKKGPAAGVGGN